MEYHGLGSELSHISGVVDSDNAVGAISRVLKPIWEPGVRCLFGLIS